MISLFLWSLATLLSKNSNQVNIPDFIIGQLPKQSQSTPESNTKVWAEDIDSNLDSSFLILFLLLWSATSSLHALFGTGVLNSNIVFMINLVSKWTATLWVFNSALIFLICWQYIDSLPGDPEFDMGACSVLLFYWIA